MQSPNGPNGRKKKIPFGGSPSDFSRRQASHVTLVSCVNYGSTAVSVCLQIIIVQRSHRLTATRGILVTDVLRRSSLVRLFFGKRAEKSVSDSERPCDFQGGFVNV